jgi:hypothetical protein
MNKVEEVGRMDKVGGVGLIRAIDFRSYGKKILSEEGLYFTWIRNMHSFAVVHLAL